MAQWSKEYEVCNHYMDGEKFFKITRRYNDLLDGPTPWSPPYDPPRVLEKVLLGTSVTGNLPEEQLKQIAEYLRSGFAALPPSFVTRFKQVEVK